MRDHSTRAFRESVLRALRARVGKTFSDVARNVRADYGDFQDRSLFRFLAALVREKRVTRSTELHEDAVQSVYRILLEANPCPEENQENQENQERSVSGTTHRAQRARCDRCGQEVKIRRDGRYESHRYRRQKCPGSGARDLTTGPRDPDGGE